MSEADTELKARAGTFNDAVDLEKYPQGNHTRSKIYAWAKRQPESDVMYVELLIRDQRGRISWEMVIDPSETVSLIRATLKPKAAPPEGLIPPSIEDFRNRWYMAKQNHRRVLTRRLAHL